jgi:hypothetical protein
MVLDRDEVQPEQLLRGARVPHRTSSGCHTGSTFAPKSTGKVTVPPVGEASRQHPVPSNVSVHS